MVPILTKEQRDKYRKMTRDFSGGLELNDQLEVKNSFKNGHYCYAYAWHSLRNKLGNWLLFNVNPEYTIGYYQQWLFSVDSPYKNIVTDLFEASDHVVIEDFVYDCNDFLFLPEEIHKRYPVKYVQSFLMAYRGVQEIIRDTHENVWEFISLMFTARDLKHIPPWFKVWWLYGFMLNGNHSILNQNQSVKNHNMDLILQGKKSLNLSNPMISEVTSTVRSRYNGAPWKFRCGIEDDNYGEISFRQPINYEESLNKAWREYNESQQRRV